MVIRQKRIRTLERHLPVDYKSRSLRVGITNPTEHVRRLRQVGFTDEMAVGDVVLPSIVGPVSRFNAEGKQVVRRDLPKETVFRQIEWHWTEYHGDREVEQSDFRYVPYERYPRDFVPPPSLELFILNDQMGQQVVTMTSIEYSEENRRILLHAINVCLELFGECHILTEALLPVLRAPVRRLNWQVLPPGRRPWAHLQPALQPIIERAKKGNQGVVVRRLDLINQAHPEFVAVGQAGFTGYVIFGFPYKNLYVLESMFYDNATYVFEERWEHLSQLMKVDILDQHLHKDRLIHVEGWEQAIRRLLA